MLDKSIRCSTLVSDNLSCQSGTLPRVIAIAYISLGVTFDLLILPNSLEEILILAETNNVDILISKLDYEMAIFAENSFKNYS